jgi:hypothetical protein
MAVTQVSRIQVRRGLQQDLPQLASAELGWSIDTRKLYIGNGTLEEGAPIVGITEILTSQSDLSSLIGTYTFIGNVAGYTAQTGSSLLNPTIRSFQQKFDDIVNVRDFGATGNGIDDDTAAINRALTQIYKATVSNVDARARRTIYFPGGTYITTNTIQIPPYTRIIGDGISSSIIRCQFGNRAVANLSDNSFSSPSVSSTLLPSFIDIQNLKLENVGTGAIQPILNVDSASNVRIQNVYLQSNASAGVYPNLVHITSTVETSRAITFDSCILNKCGNAINILGEARSIRVINSEFDSVSNTAVVMGGTNGYIGMNNYFGNVGSISSRASARNFIGLGEIYSGQGLEGGYFGNLNISAAQGISVSTTETFVSFILSNSAGVIDYEISNSSAKRFGSLQYSTTNGSIIYQDDYTESVVGINANLFANANSVVCTLSSGTGTLKYSIKQFI